MSNDVTILAALNSIEEAIRGCCGGGGLLDDTPSTATPADAYKCKAAHQIVADVGSYLGSLYQFNTVYDDTWARGTVFDNAAAFIAITLTNLSSGVAGLLNEAAAVLTGFLYDDAQPVVDLAVFDGLKTAWLADTDITCELYNSADTVAATAAIEAKVAALLGGLSYSTAQNNAALDAVTALLTNSFINRLFDTDATIDAQAAQDCAGCGCNWDMSLSIEFGTYSYDGCVYNWQSQWNPVQSAYYVSWVSDTVRRIKLFDLQNWAAAFAGIDFRLYATPPPSTPFYQSSTPPDPGAWYCVRAIYITSSSDFTVSQEHDNPASC